MIPPNRAEKRNLAQFTRAPILEEKFDSVYMRFTDQTARNCWRRRAARSG